MLLARQKRAKKLFDCLSPIYDFINPLIYTSKMRRRVIDEIEGRRILDVGVGTGYTTGHIKTSIGIDISWEMVKKCRYRGKIILADCMHPPFKPESFDTIISAGSLYYLPYPKKAMKIFYTLLKEGGVLLTVTPCLKILKPFIHVFSEDELKKLYEHSGFRLEIIEKMRSIAYFCKGRK